ncbi:hypothetical protein ScalyP_jg2015 [Parmales sp. scaly parma]|nr:hypothetical protein ScalyP_jg2015 [Parmales sp. scaly parma]
MNPSLKFAATISVSAIFGAVISDLLAKVLTPKKCNPSCLIVIHMIRFSSLEKVFAFKELCEELANACYGGASDCLSFELSTRVDDELELIAFERYAKSGYFKDDHDLLQALELTDREESGILAYEVKRYVETDLGHMERGL